MVCVAAHLERPLTEDTMLFSSLIKRILMIVYDVLHFMKNKILVKLSPGVLDGFLKQNSTNLFISLLSFFKELDLMLPLQQPIVVEITHSMAYL